MYTSVILNTTAVGAVVGWGVDRLITNSTSNQKPGHIIGGALIGLTASTATCAVAFTAGKAFDLLAFVLSTIISIPGHVYSVLPANTLPVLIALLIAGAIFQVRANRGPREV